MSQMRVRKSAIGLVKNNPMWNVKMTLVSRISLQANFNSEFSMKRPQRKFLLAAAVMTALGCAVASAVQPEAPIGASTFVATQLQAMAFDAVTVAAGLLLTVPFGLSTLPLLRRRPQNQKKPAGR